LDWYYGIANVPAGMGRNATSTLQTNTATSFSLIQNSIYTFGLSGAGNSTNASAQVYGFDLSQDNTNWKHECADQGTNTFGGGVGSAVMQMSTFPTGNAGGYHYARFSYSPGRARR